VLPGGDVSILESVLSGGQARNGGAIRIASGDLFVYRSTIDGNAADNGGGIHATNSSIRFNDVTVTNNTAGSAGGAIDASRGTVAVYGSRFGLEDGESGNEATFGGAIYLRSDVELLSDSDFIGNLVSTGGGAISGTALSSINVFGGIFRGNGSRFLMEGNIGFGPGGGGAISSSGASIYVANASFTENIALNGGAIYSAVEGGRFRNLDISGNTATITGGGLRLEGTSYVFDTEITGNRSERTEDTSGGGVSVGAGDWAAVFRRVNISENFANSHGGGIAIEEGATARVFNSDVTRNRIGGFSGDGNGGGGGISNRGGDLLMTNARIIFNEATENSVGGGVVSTGGSLLAFDTVISSNSAERFGGGFYLAEGYARFADSAINLNQAREAGGGAFVESGKLVLVGGGVSTNEASALPSDTFEGYGGGVAVGVRGQLYARSEVKFTGNSADSSGGSISSNGLINIQNARVVSGTADNGGGIYLGVGARAYISNTNFDFNTSTINGSAIFGRADSILVFSDSLVRNNSVTDNADGAPILVSQSAFSRIESVLYRLNTPLNEPILDAVI